MSSDSLVVLQEYDNEMLAEIAKSKLDEAGIFCALHGEYMSSIYSGIGLFPVRLMVREIDLDEAKKLIDI